MRLPQGLQHGNGLHLDQPLRPAQSGDRDLGVGRQFRPEELLSDRDQILPVPDVGEVGGQLDDIAQRRAARLDLRLQRPVDLAGLRCEVTAMGRRAVLVESDLPGDEQEGLRVAHLHPLGVGRRVVHAACGVPLDPGHVVLSSVQPGTHGVGVAGHPGARRGQRVAAVEVDGAVHRVDVGDGEADPTQHIAGACG